MVIQYDKTKNNKLTFSTENGSELDVKLGDVIAFRRARPINLASFQVRTDMKPLNDAHDTFIVSKNDIGKTIEVGEAPYMDTDMYTFTIGKSNSGAHAKLLQPTFVKQLKSGIMPESPIQLGDPHAKIIQAMGQPLSEQGYQGTRFLMYDSFNYGIPFLEEDGDHTLQIAHPIPKNEQVKGTDIIRVYGNPSETMLDQETAPATFYMIYSLDGGKTLEFSLDGTTTGSHVNGVSLLKKE